MKQTFSSYTFNAFTFASATLASTDGVVEFVTGATNVTFTLTGDLEGDGSLIGLTTLTFVTVGSGSVDVYGPPQFEYVVIYTPGLEYARVGAG